MNFRRLYSLQNGADFGFEFRTSLRLQLFCHSPLSRLPQLPLHIRLASTDLPLWLLSLAQCCKIYRVTYETNNSDRRFLSLSLSSATLYLPIWLSLFSKLSRLAQTAVSCFGRVILSLRFTTHKNSSDFIHRCAKHRNCFSFSFILFLNTL